MGSKSSIKKNNLDLKTTTIFAIYSKQTDVTKLNRFSPTTIHFQFQKKLRVKAVFISGLM